MKFQDFFTFNTSIEMISFIISILCLSKDKDPVWRYFRFYLFITCLTELFALYLKRHHHNNQWPYNISIIFEATFISAMFFRLFARYFNSRTIILAGLAVLFLVYGYDVEIHHFRLFTDITHDLINDTTNDLMSVIFSAYSLYYFYLLLRDERYVNLFYSSDFWWASGVFFYYFGTTTINLVRGKLTTSDYNVLPWLLIVLNWILYGSWSYSFICRKWLTQKSDK